MLLQDRRGDWYALRELRNDDDSNLTLRLFAQPPFSPPLEGNAFLFLATPRYRSAWEIMDLWVSPSRRRCGLGTLLVRHAISLAQHAGVSTLWGQVIVRDANYQPFLPAWYAHLGFSVHLVDDPWLRASFRMDFPPKAAPDDTPTSPLP